MQNETVVNLDRMYQTLWRRNSGKADDGEAEV